METPSSSSSSSSSSSFSFSPPTVLFADEKKGKSVAEQPIQDAGDETKDLLDLNIPWQQELETPPSPSSSSSFSFPSPPPEMLGDESKRKSVAEQLIQYDSDEMTDDQDSGLGHPFLPPKKRKFQAKLLIQENAPIGKEYKTEATKKTQLCGSFSHCAPGDAPAPVGGQDSDQVEEDQDQASPRDTANPRVKSRLSKVGPSKAKYRPRLGWSS